jgi:hypothetical protein
VNLYPRAKADPAAAPIVNIPADESQYRSIDDFCDAAGQFAQKQGIAPALEPTAEVKTISDALSFRKFILSRQPVTDLSSRRMQTEVTAHCDL